MVARLRGLRGQILPIAAVLILLLAVVWRVQPFGIRIPFVDDLDQLIERIIPDRPPPSGGESTKEGSTGTGSGIAATAAKAAGGLAARAARASGAVLNTPTNQWTRLLRNMSIWQSALLAIIAGFLLRKGALPWLANLTFGQAVAAGQAIDQQARRAPVLQWLVYGTIGVSIVGVVVRSLRSGLENLFEIALSTILPLLVFAWSFYAAPRLRTSLSNLMQALVGTINPTVDLVMLALKIYVVVSWALRVLIGEQVITITTAALSGQPILVAKVLGWVTSGVRLADAVIFDEWVGWGGLLLLAIAVVARDWFPARGGMGGGP